MTFKELIKLRRSFWFQAGFFSLLLVIFFFFIILPRFFSMRTITGEVEALYQQNERIQELILSSEHSGEKLQSTLAQLEKYQEMLPPSEELSDVLDKIASRAQADGLEVLSLKPLRDIPFLDLPAGLLKDPREQVIEALIEIKMQGSFFEVGRYVYHLENGPYKMIVRSVTMSNKNPVSPLRGGEEPDLSVDLIVSVLMRKFQDI